MPLSAVIPLECLSPGAVEQFTGRGVHGWWFGRWKQVDAAMGDRLHQESQESPFTLSPLLPKPYPRPLPKLESTIWGGETEPQPLPTLKNTIWGGGEVQAGQSAWLRITCLEEGLAQALREKWLRGLEQGGEVEIPEGMRWRVKSPILEAQAHPWAGDVAYAELARQHLMNSNPPRQWRLEFLTPTAFNSGRTSGGSDNHLPFPLPESLVKSWLRRWQAFAPIALPEQELLEWARSNLAVSSYKLETRPAREGERLRVGCTGMLSLRALEMPPYLRAAVDLLAAYSFFCGSGSHTAQGMGQTRVVYSR